MQDTAYRDWLIAKGTDPGTLASRLSNVRRVEAAYGDLDAVYLADGFDNILTELTYSTGDRARNESNPSKLAITGDFYSGLASARTHLNNYKRFLEEQDTKATVAAALQTAPASVGLSTPDDSYLAEPVEAVLSLERDLNAALRQNIAQLEPGLIIIDGGRERAVASGRIDILAQDDQGNRVVIELKAVKAPRDAVAQILAYMGDILSEYGGGVRGILIGPEFDPRAVSAARMVPMLELKRYAFQFSFEKVGTPTAGMISSDCAVN